MSEMKGFDSISTEDKERLALTGIQTDSMEGRAGSFLLVNDHVLHAGSNAEGVEVMMIMAGRLLLECCTKRQRSVHAVRCRSSPARLCNHRT